MTAEVAAVSRRRRAKMLVPLLCVLLIGAFVLASWSFYNAHVQACDARNTSLDVLRDVVAIAATPAPGAPLTQEQEAHRLAFLAAVKTRIDQARC